MKEVETVACKLERGQVCSEHQFNKAPVVEERSCANRRVLPEARIYSLVVISVSFLAHKALSFWKYLHVLSPTDWFWGPSTFFQDVFLVVYLFWVTSSKRKHHRRINCIAHVALILNAVLTFSAVSLEVFAAAIGKDIPWRLMCNLLKDWDAQMGLVALELEKHEVGLGTVLQALATASFLSILAMRKCSIPAKISAMKTKVLAHVPHTQQIPEKKRNGLVASVALYSLLVLGLRPTEPYCRVSRTPLYEIGREIFLGWLENQRGISYDSIDFLTKDVNLPSHTGTLALKDMNVVVILLESTRADVMPFDGSTPFAKEKLIDPSLSKEVTPFYDEWSRHDNTVLFPHLQSAAGYTHKSLLGIFCSQHAEPVAQTSEHKKKIVHPCLPHILTEHGYNAKFFKGMTRNFDNQTPLSKLMGFPSIYGKEDITLDQRGGGDRENFKKRYDSGWESLEDNPYLERVMKWVDQQKAVPFFLTYLTSVTHVPNPTPRNDWTAKKISDHPFVNKYLNCISYVDTFISRLIQEFERRDLMKNTLFVMMGDHGQDLFDKKISTGRSQGDNYEQYEQRAFDVSLSYHSDNPLVRSILQKKVKPNINGDWTTLDLAPTILEILGIPVLSPVETGDKAEGYPMDGRSMFKPSGERLVLSIVSPGEGLVLRDGHLVMVDMKGKWKMYDLKSDPFQNNPMELVNQNLLSSLDLDQAQYEIYRGWAIKASDFMVELRKDLIEQFETGVRCTDCSVAKLLTLESLDDL